MAEKRSSRKPGSDNAYDLAQSTGHWVRGAHRFFQQLLQAQLAPYGVKLSHWHFLRYLWEEDGLTQRELSRRVHVRESTTVAVVKEMENMGLITRVRDKNDRRKYAICFTPKGKRLTRKLLPISKAVNELGTADFTEAEVELYQTLTRRIIANLVKALPTAGGTDLGPAADDPSSLPPPWSD